MSFQCYDALKKEMEMKIKHWVFLIASVMSCISMSITAETEDRKRQQAYCAQAKRELEEARRLYEKAEYYKAVKHYGLAAKMLKGVPSGNSLHTESVQGIAECLYRVALSENVTGHRDSARELLKKAADMNHSKAHALLSRWDSESSAQNSVVNSPDDARHGNVRELKFKIGQSDSIGLIEFVWIPYEGGFWISKEELTRGQIGQICGSKVLKGWTHEGWSGRSDKPVDNLTAKRCQIVIDILNEDHNIFAYVPSEAQMLAIHNNTQKIQSWEMQDYGWFSGKYVHPTKEKKPTSLGLYDFYGNVYELCRNDGVTEKALLNDQNTHWRGGGIGSSPVDASKYIKGKKYEFYAGLRFCIAIPDSKIVDGTYTWEFQKKFPQLDREWHYDGDETSLYEIYTNAAEKLGIDVYKPKKRKGNWGKEGYQCLYETNYRFNIVKVSLTAKVGSFVIKFYNELNCLMDEMIDLEELFYKIGYSEHPIDRRLFGEKVLIREQIPADYKFAWAVISGCLMDLHMWDDIFADKESGLERIKNALDTIRQCKVLVKFRLQDANYLYESKVKEEEKERRGFVGDEDIVEIYKKHKDSLVIVTAGSKTGTGFLVDEGGKTYLYTNKHVLEEGGKSSITRIGGERIKCRTLEFNRNRDLARGEVVDSWDQRFSHFEFSQKLPNIGDDIFVIGNSDGLGVQKLLRGKIVGISIDETIIEIDANIVPGNSGSAVLNAAGKVVGIATFGIGERKFAIRPMDSDEWVRINWKLYNQQLQAR